MAIMSNTAILRNSDEASADFRDHIVEPNWTIDAQHRLSFLDADARPYALYFDSIPDKDMVKDKDGRDDGPTEEYLQENGKQGFRELLSGLARHLAEPLSVLVTHSDAVDGSMIGVTEYRVFPGSRNLEEIIRKV
jgi:hypothetical protein